MFTYEQKRIFLIAIVLIMVVPMILTGMCVSIKEDRYADKCPAIREVREFQKVFNTHLAKEGLSIDLSQAQWRDRSTYYYEKTVPVQGTEETLYCSVVANGKSNVSYVMQVEFTAEYPARAVANNEILSCFLTACFRIFAPSMYELDTWPPMWEEYSYVELMAMAEEVWNQSEAECFKSFISDHHEGECLRIISSVKEDGTLVKRFIWE